MRTQETKGYVHILALKKALKCHVLVTSQPFFAVLPRPRDSPANTALRAHAARLIRAL